MSWWQGLSACLLWATCSALAASQFTLLVMVNVPVIGVRKRCQQSTGDRAREECTVICQSRTP